MGILSHVDVSRVYEFDAELSDHALGEQNLYRLYYIHYHRIGEGRGMGPNNVGVIDWPFKPFMLPLGMSREDAFKVLSYFTDLIEASFGLEAGSFRSVEMLDEALDSEKLGFRKLKISLPRDTDDVINLFTVSGRILLFKNSDKYEKYFEWYHEAVTLDEVKEIYARSNTPFYDFSPNSDWVTEVSSSAKQFVKRK